MALRFWQKEEKNLDIKRKQEYDTVAEQSKAHQQARELLKTILKGHTEHTSFSLTSLQAQLLSQALIELDREHDKKREPSDLPPFITDHSKLSGSVYLIRQRAIKSMNSNHSKDASPPLGTILSNITLLYCRDASDIGLSAISVKGSVDSKEVGEIHFHFFEGRLMNENIFLRRKWKISDFQKTKGTYRIGSHLYRYRGEIFLPSESKRGVYSTSDRKIDGDSDSGPVNGLRSTAIPRRLKQAYTPR